MSEENNQNTPPFLRWVGGKSKMLNVIREYLPHSFNDYYEPFLGGGAVFFGIQDRIQKAYLSDVNRGLINSYNTVKLFPHKLIDELEKHQIFHSKEFYYHVRDEIKSKGMVEKAARFIYLNRAGFRGMHRVNKKGKFNVPYGYYSPKNILQRDRIVSCSNALSKATIMRCPYYKIMPKKRDFVFLDPPYHKEEKMFTEYTKDGFTLSDQGQLYSFFQSLSRKGVYAMMTHQDSRYIREKYHKYNIERIPVKRNIANGYAKDTSAHDLIIRNYQ